MKQYRNDIDGLRAIAVLLVIAFHAAPSLVPGGYIGVDVFFVISGFLITSILIRDIEAEKFSLIHFWERRARRILPALVVVVLATLAAGCLILFPEDLKALGESSIYQALFAANIYFWLDTGYFATASELKPLLHTWSLAVEEQFYFFFPIMLFWIWKLSRRWQAISLYVLFAASLGYSVTITTDHPTANFFLIPSRAWELLAGALLALHKDRIRFGAKTAEAICILGLLMVVVPSLVYTRETAFPGLSAVPPILGTTLLLAAGNRAPLTGWILSGRVIGFVGLISYSLYLWHWPLLVFPHYVLGKEFTPALRLISVSLSFGCAALSWKYVETPFRIKKIAAERPTMFKVAFGGIVALLVVSTLLVSSNGWPTRYSETSQRILETQATYSAKDYECPTNDEFSTNAILLGDENQMPSYILWGDSHALMLCQFLHESGQEDKFAGYSVAASEPYGGSAIVSDQESSLGKLTAKRNMAIKKFILASNIKHVLVAGRWDATFNDNASVNPFKEIADELKHNGVSVSFIQQVPKQDQPNYFSRKMLFSLVYGMPLKKVTFQEFERENQSARKAIFESGGQILDPTFGFFADDKTSIIEVDGLPIYHDDDHLNDYGVERMLGPLLTAWSKRLRQSEVVSNKAP